MKRDITDKDDIKLMVDTFYAKVRKDMLLAPIFFNKIPNDWGPHLDTMYRFWSTALLDAAEYRGNPFLKHVTLPVSAKHFDRWLELFVETVDTLFAGAVADEAKRRAMVMAHIFYDRIKKFEDKKDFAE